MRRLAACGVGLLLCFALEHDAAAQPWQDLLGGPWSAPQTPHPAVARIRVPQRENAIALGSGTLVDANEKLGLVITNWHVVDGAAGEIIVAFPDGFRSGGRVLKTDRDWDLAALAIWKPDVQPVPLSNQPPRPGDLLTIAGYGQGRYRAASGRCTQYVAPGLNFPYEMVEVAVSARQGDSGGPILDASGQLAGVLFGEGGGRTSGSYCRRVHQFLSTISFPAGGLGPAPIGPATTNPPPGALAAAPASGQVQSRPEDQAWTRSAPAASRGRAAPAAAPLFASATTGYPMAAPESDPIRPQAPLRPIQMAHESSLDSTPQQAESDGSAAAATNRFRTPTVSAAAEPPAAAGEWTQWLRSEPLEHIKAALAVVGAMALVMHGLRRFRSG